MTPTVVCDASAVVALLLDAGPDGLWATAALSGVDVASQAHADLSDLAVEHWHHDVLANRAWELRGNLTVYDASHVALAELLEVTLVTLDRRIPRATGIRCDVATP